MNETGDWRHEVGVRFPDVVFEEWELDSPYGMWIRLREIFESAYEFEPRDEDLIGRIYKFSDWCVNQPQTETAETDLFTCVVCCFYEHIPESPNARADMPRWWPQDALDHEPNIFRYHLEPEEFAQLKDYMRREARRYDPSLRD